MKWSFWCAATYAALTPVVSAQFPTRIALDRASFSPVQYEDLQLLANSVAAAVDQLIPGRVSEFVRGDIICFQTNAQELTGLDPSLIPPLTISTDYKLPYEPSSTLAGRTRIALFEVEPRYAPSYRERFVYQLSHELAHVKMGVRVDNYLIETLAVAVSHEVLVRLGMTPYANLEFNEQMHHLPGEVQRLYAAGDVNSALRYWQSRIPAEAAVIDDRPFQTLGAALIRARTVPWASLLGIAFATDCPLNNPPMNARLCAPDIQKMGPIQPVLLSLGFF